MSVSNESLVGLSKKDLIDIITAVRQPIIDPKQVAAEARKEAERAELGATMAQNEANRVENQKRCIHKRRDGSTPAVYIANLHRMYCQHCSGWIAPVPYVGAKPHEVNAALFDELYQLAMGVE
jgi:hypothetical protein